MSRGNKNNYYSDLNRHILPKLQKFDISQLKKKDYQLFLNSFAGKGISMVKKIRMTLVRIINYAMENEYNQHIQRQFELIYIIILGTENVSRIFIYYSFMVGFRGGIMILRQK